MPKRRIILLLLYSSLIFVSKTRGLFVRKQTFPLSRHFLIFMLCILVHMHFCVYAYRNCSRAMDYFRIIKHAKYLKICLIIIMKNRGFNRRSSHCHNGSKRRELAQHAHARGSQAFIHSHTYINSYNHVVRIAGWAISEFGIEFLIWRYLREGEQTGVPRENPPTACPLIGIT